MNRVASSVAGGIAATAVMTLMLILLEVETRSALGVFYVIARFVGTPDSTATGFAVFVAAGVVAWPLLFLALEPYLPRGPDPGARGVVFGAVLWLPFVILGRGDISGPLLVLYVGFTLLAHLAYGFTLGAVYGRLFGHAERRGYR